MTDDAKIELVHTLPGHAAEISAVAFSADSRWLFSGDRNGRGILWNRASGEKVAQMDRETINAATFLPDGQHLLTANNHRSVDIWPVPMNVAEPQRSLSHPDAVISLSVSDDGSLALTACNDGVVRLWKLDTGQVLRTLPLTAGPMAFAENLRNQMSMNGWDEEQLARKCELTATQISTLLTGRMLPSDEHRQQLAKALETKPEVFDRVTVSVAIAPDGKRGLTVQPADRIVRVWDLTTGEEMLFPDDDGQPAAFLHFRSRRGILWSAAFSSDGRRIVTAGGDTAQLWSLDDGLTMSERESMIFSPNASVAWADISPDGRYVATGSWDSTARIWDAASGQAIRKLGESVGEESRHQGRVNCAVFSPDGRWLLTAGDDRTARLWNTQDWSLQQTLSGHRGPVLHVAFSTDSRSIVTSSADHTARTWSWDESANRFVARHQLQGHSREIFQAAFSRDGGRVVTGSRDNTAIVWSLAGATPEVLHTLEGHTAAITSVAFSPDQRTPADVTDDSAATTVWSTRILTGSEDYTAILWDATTGEEILTLDGHSREVTSVGFSPDGRLVLTGSRDGRVILWLTRDTESTSS
jgi:WD40 repeat protein